MRLPGLRTASGLRKAPGLRKALWCVVTSAALVLAALAATSGPAGAAQVASTASSSARPCNIYATGGTPCVAAHSTVRALYRAYSGPLYQVTRVSDGTTHQHRRCWPPAATPTRPRRTRSAPGTVLHHHRIYDQSRAPQRPRHRGRSAATARPDAGAIANALPVTVGGHKVYGVSRPGRRRLPQRRHRRRRRPAASRRACTW